MELAVDKIERICRYHARHGGVCILDEDVPLVENMSILEHYPSPQCCGACGFPRAETRSTYMGPREFISCVRVWPCGVELPGAGYGEHQPDDRPTGWDEARR
jgi:hypothetical protein